MTTIAAALAAIRDRTCPPDATPVAWLELCAAQGEAWFTSTCRAQVWQSNVTLKQVPGPTPMDCRAGGGFA